MNKISEILQLGVGSGSTYEDYLCLYGFVATLKPKTVVEIGTNMGIGAITIAISMIENECNDGIIHTYDISQDYLNIATEQAKKLNVNQMIRFYLGTSNEVKKLNLKFDLAYIDGDHTYEGIKKDFDNLKEISDYIIFHDAYSCGGVVQLMKELNCFRMVNRPPGRVWYNGEFKRHSCYQGLGFWRKK